MPSGETMYDIPVLIQNKNGCGESHGSTEDGKFPFDRRERADGDQAFRHQLDDIAQRHPELAEHLQAFPRRAAGAAAATPPGENDEFFRRRFERPFGARFDRFGFPFDREDFDTPPQQSQPSPSPQQQPQYSQHPEGYYHPAQGSVPTQAPPKVSQATQTEADCVGSDVNQPPEVPVRGRPIQQSNTCDLTQKYEPDAQTLDEREQRSMSAPPDNKQRFVSSVHIPMGNKGPAHNEQSQTASNSGSTERVIPIHVEGRDEPIIPRSFTAGSPAPQPERVFTDEPRAQPERIFGQRPEQFTQFVREPRFANDGWHHPVFERRHGFPEEEFMERSASPSFAQKYAAPPQQQPQQKFQQAPPQQQHHAEQQTQQQEAPQPKPQQTQPLGPIEQIQNIQKDVSELLKQVEQFAGAPRDKNYLYLDEMLTRNLLKLDNIDTQGQDAIRSARKEAIRCIEKAISVLEAKAAANVPKTDNVEKMEVTSEEPKNVEENVGEQDNKSGKEEEQSKSMEVSEAQVENKEVNPEVSAGDQQTNQEQKSDQPEAPQQPSTENKEEEKPNTESAEAESKEQSGEKKEKKKIKKKKDKDEKEKN